MSRPILLPCRIPETMNKLLFLPLVLTGILSAAPASETLIERNGTQFRTYTVNPANLELHWLGPDGKPFHQFRSLQKHLASQGRRLRFVMNAGIFEQGGIPSGLLVADGNVQHPLNTSAGKGNFFLQPNGVFFVDAAGAHVLSTQDYAKQPRSPRIAVQSGPLLLQRGRIHPVFRAESTSRLHRNGVGVLPDGRVLFAITVFGQDRYPNLHEFADFFRSQGCKDALFLDGDISRMTVDPKGDIPPENYFAALFAVSEPTAD